MGVRRVSIVALASASLFAASAQGQPAKSDLQTARELLQQGKADQSLALVEPIIAQAMTKEAKDPKAICPGFAVAILQSFMKADNVNVSVTVDNDWCDAMLVKAYALNELKRPAEAAQTLGTLIGHDPNNAQYLIEYAYSVRASGDVQRGLDLYQRAGKVASKSSEKQMGAHWQAAALRGQGYAFIDLQRWDDAVKAYQKSFKYEPGNELAQKELKYIEEHRPH